MRVYDVKIAINNLTPNKKIRRSPLTITDLENARHTCAVLIQRDKEGNRKLIPLFERIENESTEFNSGIEELTVFVASIPDKGFQNH